ncbi:FadR/GntR family transcriptional regulator [Deinococcus aerolatus]|nr:FCD domain-containing protein [Deinococcus aerolatus]
MPMDAHLLPQPPARSRASDGVAAHIQREIRRRQLQPGDRICAERDLQAATGVSRAGVRESLRMLEHEGLIRTKTGPGGGILVGEPAAAPLGRTVEAFRHLSGVSPEALLDAWFELAVTCTRLAAGRAQAHDIADLQQTADAYRALDFEQASFDRVARLNLGFIRRTAEAAYNPILSLFLEALIDLIYSAAAARPPSLRQRRELVGVHDGIVQALKTGDADAAVRRMTRHLRAVRALLEGGVGRVG